MASATKLSFHKRLFLQLIAFSWTIVVCFIGFQYLREKEYKSGFLSAQLQQYNRHLLVAIEDGESYEEYIASHEKPFDDLRITLITLSGAVIFDNTIPADSLGNHSNRPEIVDAFAPVVEKNLSVENPCHRESWRILTYHGEYVKWLSKIYFTLSRGDQKGALDIYWGLLNYLSEVELEIAPYFDLCLFNQRTKQVIAGH